MYKKIIYSAILSLIVAGNSYAQDSKIYYDSIWRITNETNADYYRECSLKDGYFSGEVKDFYITGEIQMTGYYTNNKKEGEFKFYFKNGNIKELGSFENNERVGIWLYNYSNGTIQQKIDFSKNGEFKLLEYNDSLGNAIREKNKEITWKNSYLNYFSDEYTRFGHFYINGSFKNNMKNGEWTCTNENGTVLYKELFLVGKFKKRTSHSDNFTFKHPGNFLNSPFNKEEEICNKLPLENKFYRTENFIYSPTVLVEDAKSQIFYVVEIMPTALFTKKTSNSVVKQIKQIIAATHPDIKNIEITYIIQKDGSITNISIVNLDDKTVSNNIRSIIAENILWTPGYQRLKPASISKTWKIEW